MASEGMFQTSDLYLAAFLEVKGFQLLEVRRQSATRRCIFVFRDGPERSAAVASYWDDEPVSVRCFVAATKELKGRVYAALSGQD